MNNKFLENIVITGGEGLIGHSISKALRNSNFISTSLDISINTLHDITNPKIDSILSEINPSLIFHAAAHPGGKSLNEPLNNTKINSLGTMNIINWCLKKKVPIIFTSSSAVYGDQIADKLNENLNTNPGTIYGVNKVAVEDYIKILFKYHNIPFIIFRLFATYGSGHKPNTFQGIVNVMLTQMQKGKEVIVKGSLNRKRDIIYCEDAADIMLSCMRNSNSWNKIINVGSGKSITIREIIATIAKVIDKPFDQYKLIEETPTYGDPLSNVADIALLNKLSNFKLRYDLDSALREMIQK